MSSARSPALGTKLADDPVLLRRWLRPREIIRQAGMPLLAEVKPKNESMNGAPAGRIRIPARRAIQVARD
jgi:hypothetical protein